MLHIASYTDDVTEQLGQNYMKRFRILTLLLPVLVLLQAFCLAQEKKGRLCPFCKNTGQLPNPIFERWKHLEGDGYTELCSWIIEEDEVGMGLPWIVCEKCRNEDSKAKAKVRFDKLAAERLAWLEERRLVDKKLRVKKPLLHLKTKHFIWTWSIPKFTHKKKKYKMHEGLHFYAKRMEDFYSDFQRIHKITDEDNLNNIHHIYCFERQGVARKACVFYGGQASPIGKVTLQGSPSHFITWLDKSNMPTDDDFHRDLMHNVSHNLYAVYRNCWWLHEHGWVYEGSAHWWEMHYYKIATSHCFREIDSTAMWVKDKWERKVKKAVMAKKQPSLSDLLKLPGTSIPAKDHIFVWSYVDYLMFMDPKKTIDFYFILKEKKPARDAFREIWGMSVLGFEEKWKEYVIKEYSAAPDPASTKRKR